MLDFIMSNLTAIILGLVIIVLAVMVLLGYKKQARFIVYKAVMQAEVIFLSESGKGHEKYQLALNIVYSHIPAFFKIIIDAGTIDKWIEKAVDLLQDVTYDGKLDGVSSDQDEALTEEGQ